MKKINLTHQQYLKVGVITIITLFVGMFFFLMINSGSEKFSGEASRIISTPQQGTWLVLSLEKQRNSYQITKVNTQNYNKEKLDQFNRILPNAELRGLDSEIIVKQIINRKTTTIIEPFNSKTAEIAEQFTEDKNELIEYNIQDKKILQVKIPIDNKIDLTKPLEVMLQTPNIKQQIIKTRDFRKWKQLLQKPKTNLITGRAIDEENICEHLKEVQTSPELHTNDPQNSNRVNLVFIGFNHKSIEEVTDRIPYLLNLEGNGIEYYGKNLNTGLDIKPGKSWGIFYFSPLKENKNKFNFWYIDEIQKDVYDLKSNFAEPCKCRDPNVYYDKMLEKCGLNNVKVAILCDDVCSSKATYGGGHLELSTKHYTKYEIYTTEGNLLPMPPGEMKVISHEWGHLFGKLADEYYSSKNLVDQPRFPNCLPNEDIAKELWFEIFPDLKFYEGCSYSTDNIRTSKSSLMSWAMTNDYFNDVSKFYLCYQIFQKYGDVNGEFCENIFFEEFATPKEICNDGKDNDGNGKTDCQEYSCRLKGCKEFITEYQFDLWEYNKIVSTSENIDKYCHDNVDNDLNKKTDCEDPACASETCIETCGDGIDNNKNQVIDESNTEYKECIQEKEKCLKSIPVTAVYDKVCTTKNGVGNYCDNNKDCFWQPKIIFEKDSCINKRCTAHPDIYAINPVPKTCNNNLDCNNPESCKKVAFGGYFKNPSNVKGCSNSFNKCVECLDPECKYTESCN